MRPASGGDARRGQSVLHVELMAQCLLLGLVTSHLRPFRFHSSRAPLSVKAGEMAVMWQRLPRTAPLTGSILWLICNPIYSMISGKLLNTHPPHSLSLCVSVSLATKRKIIIQHEGAPRLKK